VLTNVAKTPVSSEELQLKKKARRRLVGAIVLVLLVVVFVPMFLDREQRPQKQDIDIRIPAIPGQAQGPQPVLPPAPPPPASVAAPPPPPDKPAVPSAPPSEAAPSAAVAPPPEPPAPKPAEAVKKSDAKANDSYVIQVGAFSDPANARHLVEKLKAEKVPAYTEAVKTTQGEKTRVRAGPYPTLAAAETGRTRLKTLKLLPGGDGKIVQKGE
jgi:DedD protein